jgi:hypothetical protein
LGTLGRAVKTLLVKAFTTQITIKELFPKLG